MLDGYEILGLLGAGGMARSVVGAIQPSKVVGRNVYKDAKAVSASTHLGRQR
jgi:hypothetical protein